MSGEPGKDRARLLHIRDAIENILNFTTGGREEFFADLKTQAAVMRYLEIIGEAARSVSDDMRSSHPEVPWRKIADLRNRLIHEYFNVDLELTWTIVESDLPELKRDIGAILNGFK